MNLTLSNKTALITGGSRGIGRATAIAFAQMGATVAITSRKLHDLEKVAIEIKDSGGICFPKAAHLGKIDEIKSLAENIYNKFGKIDILVNNAGTNPAMTPSMDVDDRLWDSIMNLNLKGLFFLSQTVARLMKEQGGGKIINISSADGFKPELNLGIYSISKAAIIMATKVMALEWAQYNIQVNAVAPGNVHTKLGDSRFAVRPKYEEELIIRTPLGRVAEPEEIVSSIVFLASDTSNFITGETIVVDGGLLLT